jgi:hypothetical protein
LRTKIAPQAKSKGYDLLMDCAPDSDVAATRSVVQQDAGMSRLLFVNLSTLVARMAPGWQVRQLRQFFRAMNTSSPG